MFLKLGKIFAYLKAHPESRCIVEGEEIVNSKHIVMCGIKDQTFTNINIVAFCLQTSAMAGPPHKIEINLAVEADDVKILSGTCSCKAGLSGSCKHVSAVLIHSSRFNITDFEAVSSTDVEAYWCKSKKVTESNYAVQPLLDTNCIKKFDVKRSRPLTEEERKVTLAAGLNMKKESNLAKHLAGRERTLQPSSILSSPDEKSILNQNIFKYSSENNMFLSSLLIDLNNFNIKDCCKESYNNHLLKDNLVDICNFYQGSTEWRNSRKLKITGSRCYSIYTYKKNDWAKKCKSFFNPPYLNNKFVRHGLEYEPYSLNKYIDEMRVEVARPGLIVSTLYPWLAYSPDGVVMVENKPVKLLEIKCPYIGLSSGIDSFKELPYFKNFEIKQNHAYYAQIQIGMAILNLKFCDFVLYSSFSNENKIVEIPFNEIYTSNLIKVISEKYFNNMIPYICNVCSV